ncbi:MAG: type II secretion system F family protein [bacterium]
MDPEVLPIAVGVAFLCMCMAVIFAARAFLAGRAQAAEEAEERAAAGAREDASAAAASGMRFGAMANVMRPKTLDELTETRKRLARAGMRSQEAVDLFSVIRLLSLLGGTGLFLFFLIAAGLTGGTLIFGALLIGLGFYGPQLWLRMRTSARQEKLARSLPPTLDLLVTCMEAGLNLEQAMDRVAREVDYSDPEMAEELAVVVGELRAGLSISAAFKKFADRVVSDEIRNLTNVIIQSASMGASLGRTLREYSSSARRRRELGLEEKAGKVTAGLTLPLTLCLLPSIILAMLGPAVVLIVRSMFGAE